MKLAFFLAIVLSIGIGMGWLLKPAPKPVYVETVTTDTVFAWRDTCIPKAQPKKPVVMKKRPKAPTWDRIEWIPDERSGVIEPDTAPTWENMDWLSNLLDTVVKTYSFSTPTPSGTIEAEIKTAGDLLSYKPTFKPTKPVEIKFDVPTLTVPEWKNAVGILTGIQASTNTFSPIIGVGYSRNAWNVGYAYLPNFKAHQVQGGVFVKF